MMPDMDICERITFPRRDTLALVAMPSAAGISRAYVRAKLRDWDYSDPGFIEDAELIASEVVTNAVQVLDPGATSTTRCDLVTAASLITITLTEVVDSHCLCIDVWDSSSKVPDFNDIPDADSERGRGLAIVAHLTEHFGYRYPRDGCGHGGKIVFATLPLPRTGLSKCDESHW